MNGPQEEEEEIEPVPESVRFADPLFNAYIRRTIDGISYWGMAYDIDKGKVSGDILYRILYMDGDVEHLEAHQVRSTLVSDPPPEVIKAFRDLQATTAFAMDTSIPPGTEQEAIPPQSTQPPMQQQMDAPSARGHATKDAVAKAQGSGVMTKRPAAKASAKAQAKGKAKAEPKAKAQGKAKAQPKAKGKAKAKAASNAVIKRPAGK